MMNALREEMARLCSAHRHGCRLALLFDYDGTLTPIVAHPALARLDRETRRLLLRLASTPRIGMGVVSGRELDDLRSQVGIPDLYYAGTSGLELDLRGQWVTHPQAEAYDLLIQFVAYRLRELAGKYPGAWIEDKHLGFTLHYRMVPRHRIEDLLAEADEVLQPYLGQLSKVQGPMAWEVTPALGWNKGSALRLIVESIGQPTIPVYAGDAANDAEALITTVSLGGVALGVGADAPSSAQYRLPDPAALRNFITLLAESLVDASTATVA